MVSLRAWLSMTAAIFNGTRAVSSDNHRLQNQRFCHAP